MGKLVLFYNGFYNFHGGLTFTYHIAEMFRQTGEDVLLVRLSGATRKPRLIKLGRSEMPLHYLKIEDCLSLALEHNALITNPRTRGQEMEWANTLIREAHVPCVFHDPKGTAPEMADSVKEAGSKFVCIRKHFSKRMRAEGQNAVYVPHPYSPPSVTEPRERRFNAICCSRVGFDNHIEIILEANKLLPEDKCIALRGTIDERYAYLRLPRDGAWRRHVVIDPRPAEELAAEYKFSVDMKYFPGDGGGTQYTFLESITAGAALVVHERWLEYEDSEMRGGWNCLPISGPEELARTVSQEPPFMPGYDDILKAHAYEAVLPPWRDAVNRHNR